MGLGCWLLMAKLRPPRRLVSWLPISARRASELALAASASFSRCPQTSSFSLARAASAPSASCSEPMRSLLQRSCCSCSFASLLSASSSDFMARIDLSPSFR